MHIKNAANLIGVSPITLKRWLLDGKVKEVSRDKKGWRIFSEKDIKRIQAFKDSVQEEFTDYRSRADASEKKFTVASFFSGIGGFDIGFERSGFKITLQCEINKFCINILNKHWPDVPKINDIKVIENGADLPFSDVWVGGFPCQDLSLARMGQRKGLRGNQSGLFHEFARLVGEGCPRIIVIENVHGLLNSHRGRDFQLLISSLAKLGYAIGWRTFNSQYFGVPQSRRRVYFVGCYRDWRGPASILFESECSTGDVKKSGSNGTKHLSPFKTIIGDPSKEGPVYQAIAYCLYACSARHTGTDWSRTYISYPKKGEIRRLTAKECEGIMGYPFGWTIPDGTSFSEKDIESFRYHALGNAVTPPITEWLAERINSYLAGKI